MKMDHRLDYIAKQLKEAREKKGLSQRDLSKLAGVNQAQISKAENAAVDLRLSSLVALARALDLEIVLTPRKSISAVRALVGSTETASPASRETRPAMRELNRIEEIVKGAQASLPQSRELAQIERHVRDLRHMSRTALDVDALRKVTTTLKGFDKGSIETLVRNAAKSTALPEMNEAVALLQNSLAQIQGIRNAAAHASPTDQDDGAPRPAYRLEDGND